MAKDQGDIYSVTYGHAMVTDIMPDGCLVFGIGRTFKEARFNAWLHWTPRLAIDGHAYRRRQRARVKRRRR